MRTISIKKTLLLVAACAIGFAALRAGSDLAYRWAYTLTLVALLAATLGALLDAPPRGAWHGFALFGGASFLSTFVPAIEAISRANYVSLPFQDELIDVFQQPPPADPDAPPDDVIRGFVNAVAPGTAAYARDRVSYLERAAIVRKMIALELCWLVGFAGSVLGRRLGAPRRPGRPAPASPGST